MPFRMGPLEIIIILVIVLLIFGVGKLPQVGDALGKGIRAFRKGQSGEEEEKGKETEEAPTVEKVAVAEVTEAKAEVTEAKAEEKKEEKSGESA